MNAESPGFLILLLAVLTLLGCVIGYCVALIMVKNSARRAIEESRMEMQAATQAAAPPMNEPSQLYDRSASERERALVEKSQGQARHIQELEDQVSSLEDQQQRLQRHFASFKASTNRELVGARHGHDTTDDLPTLSRRVDPVTGRVVPSRATPTQSNLAAKAEYESSEPSRSSGTRTSSRAGSPATANELELEAADSDHGTNHRDG